MEKRWTPQSSTMRRYAENKMVARVLEGGAYGRRNMVKVSTTDELVVCSRRRYRIYVFIFH